MGWVRHGAKPQAQLSSAQLGTIESVVEMQINFWHCSTFTAEAYCEMVSSATSSDIYISHIVFANHLCLSLKSTGLSIFHFFIHSVKKKIK